MAEEKKEAAKPADEYKKPEGARNLLSVRAGEETFHYEAEADWIVLRKEEKPQAEMFYVRYFLTQEDGEDRPITFVFNGGPGAASVYLHMGAPGPRRVDLSPRGVPSGSPYRLTDNRETWLAFTDLVFIDPIGTGFSRLIDEKDKEKEKEEKKDEYWKLNRDLESLGEFMRKFLSLHHRWESPVFLAGESYGGFRVGKLAKMVQKDYGIGLAGAILISPALEFSLLSSSDYDALPWVDTFPTMAAAAAYHGKARKQKSGETFPEYGRRAAEFALKELLPVLAGGNSMAKPSARGSLIPPPIISVCPGVR